MDDVITFDEGDEFEVTGYYKTQTDVQGFIITENKEVTFSFIEKTPLSIKENGAIKAAFSVGNDKKYIFRKEICNIRQVRTRGVLPKINGISLENVNLPNTIPINHKTRAMYLLTAFVAKTKTYPQPTMVG